MKKPGDLWETNFNGTPELGLVVRSRYKVRRYYWDCNYSDVGWWVHEHDVVLVGSLLMSMLTGDRNNLVRRKWKEEEAAFAV